MMFVDAMKTSRAWGLPDKPWEHTVKTDTLGWPQEDAGVVVLADGQNLGGTYSLLFQGRAQVGSVASKATIQNLKYDATKNLTSADVVMPADETQLMLSFTGTQGGVKNVSLLRPGYATNTKEIFTREFLQALKPFPAVRFMDFTATNGNPMKIWGERTTPASASQARAGGGALEYAIALCNQTGKDMWINVPHEADDDYIRKMATMLKSDLKPEIKLYLEWSNEVWNWSFGQAQRNLELAKIEGAKPGSNLNYDKIDNPGYWHFRRFARETMETGNIFRAVFGDKAMMTRIRTVLAVQAAWDEGLKTGLSYIEANYGAPSKFFYGVAIAPYFNLSEEMNKRADLKLDEIFAALPQEIENSLSWLDNTIAHARYYNLQTLAYEGGQHLQDHSDVGNAKIKVEANRDPRMGALMKTYLDGWNARGGGLFMYFTLSGGYSKWGSWGLVEDVRETTSSSKYQAALQVVRSPRAPLTAGTAVPGLIKVGDFGAQSHCAKRGDAQIGLDKDAWLHYLLRVPKAGKYKITVQAFSDNGDLQLEVLANSKSLGIVTAPKRNGDIWPDTKAVIADLPVGLNVVGLKSLTGRVQIKSFSVAQ